jgi:hypothetical protein
MSTGGRIAINSRAITSRYVTSWGQTVLYLTTSRDAGGSIEASGASALGHTSIRHYLCSRAGGKAACGQGKTTSKVATIKCCGGTTSPAPATSTSAAAAIKTPESSPPCIALFKAERVNLSNNLVHVLMHEILLQSKLRELLFSALA